MKEAREPATKAGSWAERTEEEEDERVRVCRRNDKWCFNFIPRPRHQLQRVDLGSGCRGKHGTKRKPWSKGKHA